MRPKPMLICSGLAGAVLMSCLGASAVQGQQTGQQGAIVDLQFDQQATSRRSSLDLFNLQTQRSNKPHFTTLNAALENQRPNAPVAGGPLAGINFEQDGAVAAEDPAAQTADPAASANRAPANAEQSGDNVELRPDQDSPLRVSVVAVNLETKGVVPTGATRTSAKTAFLPSGYEHGAQFTCVHWQPSLVCHYPLYFEDAMLERHGHVRWGRLQSLASGVKFYSTLPMLPYLYTLRPKHECIYQTGQYRAGSCAPLVKDHLPYDKHAAVVEALALGGFFWAMPL